MAWCPMCGRNRHKCSPYDDLCVSKGDIFEDTSEAAKEGHGGIGMVEAIERAHDPLDHQAENVQPQMRLTMCRFTMYRRGQMPDTHTPGVHYAPRDDPQFEGVIFSDGTVCLRWLTLVGSHSIWPSFEAAMRIHGHREYQSLLVIHDPVPADITADDLERLVGAWVMG